MCTKDAADTVVEGTPRHAGGGALGGGQVSLGIDAGVLLAAYARRCLCVCVVLQGVSLGW